MTIDIDWLAVEMACEGYCLRLRRDENLAVVRRLNARILTNGERTVDLLPGQLTIQDVAKRLKTTGRSVNRWRAQLPPADEAKCAVCGQVMWVRHDGQIEPHPNRLNRTCTGMQRQESV